MSWPAVLAATITLASFAAYVNHRFLRLPATPALVAMALIASIVVLALLKWTAFDMTLIVQAVNGIDFRSVLLDGILPYLLMAGALHVDVRQMRPHALAIALLATVGVVLATVLTGTLMWGSALLLGSALAFSQAILFGALIAPTDPIAVLAVLRAARTPESLSAVMAGESLLNDGVGVVLFVTLLGMATGHEEFSLGHLVRGFLLEGAGGVAFGLLLGYVVSRLLAHIDDYPVEIFVTLGLASGSYAFANALHLSGPLAVVAAGLVLTSLGRERGMSAQTQRQLDAFWQVVDEVLNAILFMLVGLEALVVVSGVRHVELAIVAVAAVLIARWASVLAIVGLLRSMGRRFARGTVRVLTWGGLRGGISIALVLSLPEGEVRDTLLTATYAVVIFTMLVQALTLGALARRFSGG